jgi:hypothetical protein
MNVDCPQLHYADHIQDSGHTAAEHNEAGCGNVSASAERAKTFQELEKRMGGFHSSRRFAKWLDENGYKTFPTCPTTSPDRSHNAY